MHLAKSVFLRVNIEHVLIEEVLRLRPELRQPAFLTNKIEKYLGLKRLQKLHPNKEYDLSKIRSMVEQFEAIYCYANCKSIIMSEVEAENPLFSCLVKGFQVERNSHQRAPYYGLKAHENSGQPINKLVDGQRAAEVLADYSLLGRICFYESFKFINQIKMEVLDQVPVFQEPISLDVAYQIFNEPILGQNYDNPRQLIEKISAYPLKDLKFALAYKALS